VGVKATLFFRKRNENMNAQTPIKNNPKLLYALTLRCPYCGKTPLRRKGSFFDFGEGCPTCNYKYSREGGYFTGSSWMINYTTTSLVGIAVAAYCALSTNMGGLMIATVASISIVVFGLLFFPFGNALWIYFDHLFHPLQERDRLK
jgi:transposase-like protein